jgi:hypothetical protein
MLLTLRRELGVCPHFQWFRKERISADRHSTSRLDDLADGAAVERFAQLERRNIRFPVVNATAHVWIR